MTIRTATLPAGLRPDCSTCCGLCCVAPAFDAAQGFGYDKPARTPCVNLRPDFRCAIHDRLAEKGYPGCIAFDCYGAGQRITREMFDGAAWRDSGQATEQIFIAFTRLCVLHELMALLTIARQRVMETDLQARLGSKLLEIEGLCRTEPVNPGATDVSMIKRQTMDLLRELESSSIVDTLKKGAASDS